MAAPNMRIGLLGGSFNPAHAAHRHISLAALKRLGLDQVWWLVSPGNPLKDAGKLPDLEARIEVAREVAHHPKIVVTGFEAGRPSAYTVDTIGFLKRRYPSVDFVWLMGADNLASFHRWRAWEKLFAPRADRRARPSGLPAEGAREQGGAALCLLPRSTNPMRAGLASMEPPAWTLLSLPLSSLSSTRLRGGMEGESPRAKTLKAAKAVKKLAKKAKKTAKRRRRMRSRRRRQEGHKEK